MTYKVNGGELMNQYTKGGDVSADNLGSLSS